MSVYLRVDSLRIEGLENGELMVALHLQPKLTVESHPLADINWWRATRSYEGPENHFFCSNTFSYISSSEETYIYEYFLTFHPLS